MNGVLSMAGVSHSTLGEDWRGCFIFPDTLGLVIIALKCYSYAVTSQSLMDFDFHYSFICLFVLLWWWLDQVAFLSSFNALCLIIHSCAFVLAPEMALSFLAVFVMAIMYELGKTYRDRYAMRVRQRSYVQIQDNDPKSGKPAMHRYVRVVLLTWSWTTLLQVLQTACASSFHVWTALWFSSLLL